MLYLVKRIGLAGYDEYLGFVVRAAHESEARSIASGVDDHDALVWVNGTTSTCVAIDPDGPSGVILGSYRHG